MTSHYFVTTALLCFLFLILPPKSICTNEEAFRIQLRSASTPEVKQIQMNKKSEIENNNYSPFDKDLMPTIWMYDVFVGNRKNPKERGQIVSFSMELDSGDTWILEYAYQGGLSTTFSADKQDKFVAMDLFGKVSGYAARDDMNIVGAASIFKGQKFGMVTNDEAYSEQWYYEGKLGMAWPGAGSALNASLIYSLEPLKRFTISFDQNDHAASYALFGQVDCDNCNDFWANVPLHGDLDYWKIALLGFTIDTQHGEDIDVDSGHQVAMLSNRLQFIYGPGSYIEKLVMALGGSGSQHKDNRGRIWYDVNCFNSDKLPYITLNLENKEYLTISPKDYVKRVSAGYCVLLFAQIEQIRSEFYAKKVDWIIGLPVLRRYCQLYDMQNKEISFARAQTLDGTTLAEDPFIFN